MSTSNDPFFRVSQTKHETSQGTVELPILYYDVTNVVGLFAGDRAGATELLASVGLRPVLTSRKSVLVGMSFYEYRKTTVGVYNEVALVVFAVPKGQKAPLTGAAQLYLPLARRKTGAYVVDLPVTTEMACAAGRELWGYPKFVASIPFHLAGRRFETGVSQLDGENICVFYGRMGASVPAPSMSALTFSRKEGQLLQTKVEVRGRVRAHLPGSMRLNVGGASHPMAENLRRLGLEDARPKVLLVSETFQSKLYGGTPVDE